MAEQSGFFDAHLVDGEYDRVYLAESFAKYFASFIGNGIFGGKSNELIVRQKETASMGVRVLAGQAWINGYWYENSSELSLAIDIADGVLNRIDSIMVRWNHSDRVIRTVVKKGTPASTPTAPVVQRDSDYYELKLADIYIKAGATSITQANITDKRYNTDVCGLVVGVVQQLDPDEFGIQLDTFIQEFMAAHNTWSDEFKEASQDDVDTFLSENQTKVDNLISTGNTNINKVVSDGNTKINNVVSTGTTNINNLITNKTEEIDTLIDDKETEFNQKIAEVEEIAADQDLVAFNRRISDIEAKYVESTDHPGCYYRIVDGETEWLNPPNEFGVEYRLTERHRGEIVYMKTIYAASLPNNSTMSINTGVPGYNVISLIGRILDTEENIFHPIPYTLPNQTIPTCVISSVEYDGELLVYAALDLYHCEGHFTIKYVKP